MRYLATLVAAAIAGSVPSTAVMAQSAPAGPVAPTAENLVLAREIIANGYPPEIRHAMYDSVMANMMAQMRKATEGQSQDPGVKAIVDRNMEAMRKDMLGVADKHMSDIFDSFARAYARGFSTADLTAIRDFSRTSAGKNFISRSSQLLSDPDVAAANQAFIREAMGTIAPNAEKLKAELLAYMKAHPSTAQKAAKANP